MFEQLEKVQNRLEEVLRLLSQPSAAEDVKSFQKLMKEQAEITPIVQAYTSFLQKEKAIEEDRSMLEDEKDPEMRELLKEEISESTREKEDLILELKRMLIPKDPWDDKNVVVEIRAGTGGDEAALFAAEIYRMYQHYAEKQGWKSELVSVNENGLGGFKECIFLLSGEGVYARMKYESGVHRVQRVPETESGGRIHTSAITVAIMPEAEEVEVEIDPKDIRFDVFRSSGNGGQSVNTTDSAVRLTHLPTGIVISSQDEKSQLKNKNKALKVLRAMLLELQHMEQSEEESERRRSQIGSGDRSEKIRTYNFPQGRVTEHRINLTIYRIDQILSGDLSLIHEPLMEEEQARKLASMEEI